MADLPPATDPKCPRLAPEAEMRVKKLSADASLPKRASPQAAGYDLCSAHAAIVPAHGRAVVRTDLAIAVPPGCYGRVAPRSGLAVKHFIDTGGAARRAAGGFARAAHPALRRARMPQRV